MICWHKYSKWNSVETYNVQMFDQSLPKDIPIYTLQKLVQQKECIKCGLVKKRVERIKL